MSLSLDSFVFVWLNYNKFSQSSSFKKYSSLSKVTILSLMFQNYSEKLYRWSSTHYSKLDFFFFFFNILIHLYFINGVLKYW